MAEGVRRRVYELAARWQPEYLRLPSVKLGERQVRFRPADVERYIEERASASLL
jgi:predicted DNA-binding transcriptional regulator AlpA